jgi:hypothetical protein
MFILILNLINKEGQLEREVYRKPAATDITINSKNSKNTNLQHTKIGYTDSLHYYSKHNKKKELNTIFNIALNNGYRKEDIIHIYKKLK